jgi:hypothetical protein
MLDLCMTLDHTYLTWSMYSNLSWCRQQGWTDPLLSRKSAPDSTSQPGWVVHGTHLSFSPNTANEVVRSSQTPNDDMLQWLLDTYHQHAIDTFNICSWGPSHRSLTNKGGGYSLGGADFPQTTPSPSQPTVSTFHLRAPPGLQFNQVLPTKSKLSLRNLWPPHGPSTTRPSTMAYHYA